MLTTVWSIIAIGITTLLVAANSKDAAHKCKDVVITLKGVGESFYIDKSDVSATLLKSANGKLKKKNIADIDLEKLEKSLEKNKWIADAEVFFDSKDVLHAVVTERQPIARVFTTVGTSFYLDTAALRMPLLDKVSIRVPVVTNFPSAKKLSKKDSMLLKDVKVLTQFINNDPFWSAQIAQIDITDGRAFELVPVIGNHIIKIGGVDNIEQKFHKLFIFYQKVIAKVGFEKYSFLDVQYNRQVVATHKGATSVIDSIQLRKNIEDLLKRNMLQEDSEKSKKQTSLMEAGTPEKGADQKVTDAKADTEKPSIIVKSETEKANNNKPVGLKAGSNAKSVAAKKPKAVMPKKQL